MLDAAEYLHLAIHASAKGDHHAALTYLKETLAQEPQNAKAIYLLAAEHAELGLFDRAVTGMEAALALDGGIEMARFQLGLLLLQRNELDRAKTHLEILTKSTDLGLRAFAEAMLALAADQVATAQEKLALGLARSDNNPALKADMQRMLDRLMGGNTAQPAGQAVEAEAASVFLGAYQRSTTHEPH